MIEKLNIQVISLLLTFIMITLPGVSGMLFGELTNTTNLVEIKADPNSALKKEQEKLSLENSFADQALKKNLQALTAEKQRLDLENSITQQRLISKLSNLLSEIEDLNKKIDVANKRSIYKEIERKYRLDTDLLDIRDKLERLRLSNDLTLAENTFKNRENTLRQSEIQIRMSELQLQRMEFDAKIYMLNAEIDLRDKKDLVKNRVTEDIKYTKEPFKAGVLTISDRRIALNGIITMETADDMIERINYFNNQNNEYPIFMVIDTSPGGSVMAGYKILKAMEGSPAPIYVVVKSFAASMAAGITTLSKKSFAYPNALILHHQILSFSFGNLTEQKESVKDLEE